MSEIATTERASAEPEKKPVVTSDDVKFPPFPGRIFNSIGLKFSII